MNKYLLILVSVIIGLLIANIPLNADNNNKSKEKYYNAIRSTVRLKADQGRQTSGSGTVFKVIKFKDVYYNYIITADHVTNHQQVLFAEYFKYDDMHSMVEMVTFPALNVAHNTTSDLALLLCVSNSRMNSEISLISSKNATKMKLADDIFISGCPLARLPQITKGNISIFDEPSGPSFRDLVSAPIIFGSSGGGVYTENGELFGVVSAVSTVNASNNQLISVAYPHIGWIIPNKLIYSFLIESGHGFLINVKDDSSFINALRLYNNRPVYR